MAILIMQFISIFCAPPLFILAGVHAGQYIKPPFLPTEREAQKASWILILTGFCFYAVTLLTHFGGSQ